METTVNQDVQQLKQYKPLFDTLISYTQCTGYTFVGTQNGLVCAEFRFVGGKFPLALDPKQPIPHNVDNLQRVLRTMQFIARLPQLKPVR